MTGIALCCSLVTQMVKKPSSNAGDVGSILESGRSPGEGNGDPLQYSCLENSMEPGMLQSMGSERAGHNLMTKQQQQQHCHFLGII